LVKKLYRTEEEVSARDSKSSNDLLFEDANKAICTRKKIKPNYKPEWVENFLSKLSKCCRTCKIRDEKYVYLKAKERLEGELDINQFIKHGRLLRNAFKFLTTKRERHLVRMQADKNVIVVRE
jgi:hypothetical protein